MHVEVQESEQHSEDLIKDPETVEWIGRYAERYKELVDPIWEQIMNNPTARRPTSAQRKSGRP